jgi:predicted transcriptional regulator
MEGWVKVYRKMLEWQWLNKPEMVSIFLYCLLRANHNGSFWQGQEICRGQFITSPEKISNKLGITYQTVRTCLTRLEKTGEINKQTTNKYTIITVCNYDSYQVEKQTTNKETNKQLTNNQQTTNKQLTTDKNVKNVNNENNYNIKLGEIENLLIGKKINIETCLTLFEKWKDYLAQQHDVIIQDNEFGLEILIDAITRVGAQKLKESIDFSITSMYKKIYPKPEPQQKQLKHLNQAAKHDSDKF